MLAKKNKKLIYCFIILFFLSLFPFLAFNSYKKTLHIDKNYIGICRDNLTENFVSKISIQISADYEKAFTMSHFKALDRLSGSIIINGIEYDLFGISIYGENNLIYIGASAYDTDNGNTTHFIFILDNFENIILSEVGNEQLTKTYCAPAQTIDEFNMILNKLN